MKYAIITDIHANLEALTAVFERIDALGVEAVICLGDIAGYHANPNECIKMIRDRGVRCITGNHDRAAAGLKEPVYFGEAARRAIIWTRNELTEESRWFLKELPVFEVIDQTILVVHAGVHPYPNEDVRLNTSGDVIKSFEAMERVFPEVEICFVGHSHRSLVYQYRDATLACIRELGRSNGRSAATEGGDQVVCLESTARYLVNPGSVGQSRDGDPRAAFLIYDDTEQTLRFHRVEYDWESCYRKAERAGLMYKETQLRKSLNWVAARVIARENIVRRSVATGKRMLKAH